MVLLRYASLAAAGLFLLAGCLDAPVDAAPPEPGAEPDETATLLIALGTPRSAHEEYRMEATITAPDGTIRWGAGFIDDAVEEAPCWVGLYRFVHSEDHPCYGPGHQDGDLHQEAPETRSTYPYFEFPAVAYNGTWTLTIERIYSREFLEDDAGVKVQEYSADHCSWFIMGAPNGTLRVFSGDGGWQTPDCIRNGTWEFDYPNKEWILLEGDVKHSS